MNDFLKVLTTSFLLVAGALIAYLGFQAMPGTLGGVRPQVASPTIHFEPAPIQRETRLATSFAPVVEKAAPSVVYISASRTVRTEPRQLNPFFEDPFFRRFFGDQFQPEGQPRERRQQGLGSGVIVSADGYILTNNHVIEGADEIKITLGGGRDEYLAQVVGTDPPTDIALLKIDASQLPAITITDSDNLKVGDVVLAIGNPFGQRLSQTVTMGIVSATGRRGLGLMDYEDFIQTDASINPGNSGGALVDAEGRLVGINTAIFTRSGANHGIGFAVPINMARLVMEGLIGDGNVSRGFLGVRLQHMTRDLADALKLPGLDGALVAEVDDKTPAAEAGIREGDVIIEFDGRKVADRDHLRLMVSQTPPGTTVPLTVLRDGKRQRLDVTLGALSPDGIAGKPHREDDAPAQLGALQGVEVGDITPRLRQQFEIPDSINGVLVMNVRTDSPAYAERLRPGDVILEINRRPLSTAEEAIGLSRRIEQEQVLLRVWSREQRGSRFLVVDTSRKR